MKKARSDSSFIPPLCPGWTGRVATPTMTLPFFNPSATGADPTMAHVLLIDDDPGLIPEQVRQALPAPRYRVEVAGTGAEGLERVRSKPPDVILLDLRLPDQSG